MQNAMYRTHYCNELRGTDVGRVVKLAGWVKDVRNLGKMFFVTIRDHYGVTQLSFPSDSNPQLLERVATLKPESIIVTEGRVISRGDDANPNMETGEIEVVVNQLHIDSLVRELPFQLYDENLPKEDLRLKYRFLDLRRDKLQRNLKLRFEVMQMLRNYLADQGFLEIQTPILTASSPEGARDFVVPSRMHPGKFYALPQAPQQYKQLLMCSGIDKYFQIAPCFRDEDARADRSPGEFYQLDIEMAFATQEGIFELLEDMFQTVTEKLTSKQIMQLPFPQIAFKDSMEWYGSDKPDIRFDMKMIEVTEIFKTSTLGFMANAANQNQACIKALIIKGGASQSNKYYKKLEAFVKEEGLAGMPYFKFLNAENIKGSIAKGLASDTATKIALLDALKKEQNTAGLKDGDGVIFFLTGKNVTKAKVLKVGGKTRLAIASQQGILEDNLLAFCWIVDFPMYEEDEEGKWDFSHNPFSMPQGGMKALDEAIETGNLATVLAYQYDIVCNGIELSSGAIRNHRPDIMYKAFEIVGHSKEKVNEQFGHMINAFSYGAPPHGGIAPGLDRMIMIFADEPNIREVIAFPLNQSGQDPMMSSPAALTQEQLDELHLLPFVPPDR